MTGDVVLQAADLRCRRDAEDHLRRRAVVVDVLDVAADSLEHAEPLQLFEDFTAELERVAALGGVEEVGCGAGPLLPIAIVLVLLMRAGDLERARVAEVVRFGAVGDLREVIAEVAVARFDIELVAERAVPFRLVDPAAGILPVGGTFIAIGVSGLRQTVGLDLLAPLIVANQLVLLVNLVGALANGVPQLGVERLVELEVRLLHGVELRAVGPKPPNLVALDRTAEVDVGVVIAIDLVAVRANRGVVERRRRGVLVGYVRALQRVVVPIEVVLTIELVAAGAGDELALHARVRHFGGLTRRAKERFLERRVVEVEAGAAGAFGRIDAFDQHAHLTIHAVGAVAGLRAG